MSKCAMIIEFLNTTFAFLCIYVYELNELDNVLLYFFNLYLEELKHVSIVLLESAINVNLLNILS